MGRTSEARERLIVSAGELWHARSYGDVGVNEICEHAKVQKGSFYHFFPSKRDLALAVIDEYWRLFSERFLAPASASEGPPLERIGRLIELELAFLAPGVEKGECICGCPFGNLASEMATKDEVLRQRLERLFEDWLPFFEAALTDAAERGDIPPGDMRQTAQAMQAYVEGVILMAKTKNDVNVIRELAPHIFRLAGAPPEGTRRRRKAA